MTIIAGFADFMLLTNFKASVLITVCTLVIIFLNYRNTISAIGETSGRYHATIFQNVDWYKAEWRMTYGSFLCAASCALLIIMYWYLPKHYSINWVGLLSVLFIVPITSIIAGVLGTKRGLQKYAV